MSNHNLFRKTMTLVSAIVLSLAVLFSAPAAIAKPIGPCVIDPPSICTRDVNQCGNASICACPDGYEYSDSVGKCLVIEVGLGDGSGVPVKSKCASEPESICTKDINACGHASVCACPGGTTYSPIVGQCIKDI